MIQLSQIRHELIICRKKHFNTIKYFITILTDQFAFALCMSFFQNDCNNHVPPL